MSGPLATAPKRVLITGAGGSVGTCLRAGLTGNPLMPVRTTDLDAAWMPADAEEVVTADIRDLAACLALTRDVDTVIHLAGIPHEAEWNAIVDTNIHGTFNIFEAARVNRVRRVIFASTHHVVGFHRRSNSLDAAATLRPDSRYAVSKVCGEALGRLYADKFGMEVCCLRIGSFRAEPEDERMLATWLSPRDLLSLVRSVIETPSIHFVILYGMSGNTRRMWENAGPHGPAYSGVDDAESFAATILSRNVTPDPVALAFHGGQYCSSEFAGDPERID